MITNIQIEMGVSVSLVVLEFPIEFGMQFMEFGINFNVGIDIKVLRLTIFLNFKLCAGISPFEYCYEKELWSMSATAWHWNNNDKKFIEYGLGSCSDKSTKAMPVNADAAKTNIRFYFV